MISTGSPRSIIARRHPCPSARRPRRPWPPLGNLLVPRLDTDAVRLQPQENSLASRSPRAANGPAAWVAVVPKSGLAMAVLPSRRDPPSRKSMWAAATREPPAYSRSGSGPVPQNRATRPRDPGRSRGSWRRRANDRLPASLALSAAACPESYCSRTRRNEAGWPRRESRWLTDRLRGHHVELRQHADSGFAGEILQNRCGESWSRAVYPTTLAIASR